MAQSPARTSSSPVRVQGRFLVDRAGQHVLLRGTQLPELAGDASDFGMPSRHAYGPLSATTLNAIRKRWNMNTVRLPVDVGRYLDEPSYAERLAQAVRIANRQDLLVILAAVEPGSDLPSEKTIRFWKECGARFRDNAGLLFDLFSTPRARAIPGHRPGMDTGADWRFWLRGGRTADGHAAVGMQGLADAIRGVGVAQPLIVTGLDEAPLLEGLTPEFFLSDAGVIYETNVRFNEIGTDAQGDRSFGVLSAQVPLVVNDADLHLDRVQDCQALPQDPAVVERTIQSTLTDYDRLQVSWTISTFAPGKLISDYRHFFATTLANGLPCGSAAGIGTVVQYHLIGVPLRGLVTTALNATFVLARGAAAQSYGPTLSEAEADGNGALPQKLSNIAVEVFDSGGVARLAPLLHVGIGWSFVNFVVPPDTAKGPAKVSIVRSDGSRSESSVLIADLSPALLTGNGIGWGPVIAIATQTPPSGPAHSFLTYQCGKADCTTIPIPLSKNVSTTVRLLGDGFRNAAALGEFRAEIGGTPVPVVSFGPAEGPGADQVTLRLPSILRGMGETDLMLTVSGRPANVVRINCGS